MLNSDIGKGKDNISMCGCCGLVDKGRMKASWKIEKYGPGEKEAGLSPYEVDEWEYNLLLNEGINELWTLVCAATGTRFDNTNAYLGVGDSNTAASATQTGLQAAVNKLYKGMEAGFPTYGTSQQAAWKSSFGSAEANFAWNEFTVANGNSDSADNLNRKVESKGTKSSGDTWDLTLTITLS
jgi:hypothetical protein